jgi:hypothetical protein
MILAAAFALCLLTVPLFGGRLSRLSALPIRRQWTILAALALQVLIISVLPFHLPATVAAGLHLFSYGLTLVFAAANWRIPGMMILVAGGVANLTAIGANGGVMPASQRALEVAGLAAPEGGFVNSDVQPDAHLLFLGDVFALPRGFLFANVFSIGDLLLVVGGTVVAHRGAGSSLPRPARRTRPGPAGTHRASQDQTNPDRPNPDRPNPDRQSRAGASGQLTAMVDGAVGSSARPGSAPAASSSVLDVAPD